MRKNLCRRSIQSRRRFGQPRQCRQRWQRMNQRRRNRKRWTWNCRFSNLQHLFIIPTSGASNKVGKKSLINNRPTTQSIPMMSFPRRRESSVLTQKIERPVISSLFTDKGSETMHICEMTGFPPSREWHRKWKSHNQNPATRRGFVKQSITT